jgi:hypothetical protein
VRSIIDEKDPPPNDTTCQLSERSKNSARDVPAGAENGIRGTHSPEKVNKLTYQQDRPGLAITVRYSPSNWTVLLFLLDHETMMKPRADTIDNAFWNGCRRNAIAALHGGK